MRRKKVKWGICDIFAIPLKNGKYSIGHILDQRMVNTLRIALFDEIFEVLENIKVDEICDNNKLISLIEVTKVQVDYGVWKIIGNKKSLIPIGDYPNEKFRKSNFVGSIVYDAGLAEDFVDAFYSLAPWDNWYDPNFLDEFLVNKIKKPRNLIYTK